MQDVDTFMMSRAEALEKIVTFDDERDLACDELVKFGYDSENKYFTVSKSILINVLRLFLSDRITADELEEWASFIECRDELHYEEIEGYIYALANPSLIGDINKVKIIKMVELLTVT
jgi:hypothetical protein